MRATTASRVIGLEAGALFDRVTALANHERLIPATRIDAPRRRPAVGDTVVATSFGVLRDEMLLVRYDRPDGGPGVATYRKLGPLLLGTAEITVSPLGPRTARVDWTEEVRLVAPLRFASAPAAWAIERMTVRALRLLATATHRTA